MFHKILVAIDDSDVREQVFDAALALAQTTNAQLTLLHVLFPGDLEVALPAAYPYSPTLTEEVLKRYDDQREELYRQGLDLLKALETKAIAAGIVTQATQTIGNPGRVICTMAKDEQADTIVMGRRGRSGFNELLLGSVSNYVLHHAPCSVLVVQGSIKVEAVEPDQQVAMV